MRTDKLKENKWELDTPCLVLDISILKRNITYMQDFAERTGKKIRPHVKTHKCSQIARLQLETGAIGLCAAKISEAEQLIAKGLSEVLITSPVVTSQKISRLINCLKKAPELTVVVDNAENAATLNCATEKNNVKINVLVGIDPGLRRTGVPYEDALEFGIFINQLPGLHLKGIQCYAGHLQHLIDYKQRKQESLECMRKAASIFRSFRKNGLPCSILSGTGTGSFDIDSEIDEITDFQVGSYVVMDSEYLNIGSADNPNHFDAFNPSLTLLTTVISNNQEDFVTVDAGLKALYFTPKSPPMVVTPAGKNWHYEWFGDEHGKIVIPSPSEKPSLGAVIELTTPHCDPTINLFDHFYIVENDIAIDKWSIDLRGCST